MNKRIWLFGAGKIGKEYVDEIVWNYTGEKNRGTETYENQKVHSGF